MAVALTGQYDWDRQATSSATLVYPSPGTTLTAGRTVELFFGYLGAGVTISSVVDSLGNTYTPVDTATVTAGAGAGTFIKTNILGGADPTFTITLSGAATNRTLGFREWSGTDTSNALAGHRGNGQDTPGTGTDAATSLAMTP